MSKGYTDYGFDEPDAADYAAGQYDGYDEYDPEQVAARAAQQAVGAMAPIIQQQQTAIQQLAAHSAYTISHTQRQEAEANRQAAEQTGRMVAEQLDPQWLAVHRDGLGNFLAERPELLPDRALEDPNTAAEAIRIAAETYDGEMRRALAQEKAARADAHLAEMRNTRGSARGGRRRRGVGQQWGNNSTRLRSTNAAPSNA